MLSQHLPPGSPLAPDLGTSLQLTPSCAQNHPAVTGHDTRDRGSMSHSRTSSVFLPISSTPGKKALLNVLWGPMHICFGERRVSRCSTHVVFTPLPLARAPHSGLFSREGSSSQKNKKVNPSHSFPIRRKLESHPEIKDEPQTKAGRCQAKAIPDSSELYTL